jgi:hypothetical protein
MDDGIVRTSNKWPQRTPRKPRQTKPNSGLPGMNAAPPLRRQRHGRKMVARTQKLWWRATHPPTSKQPSTYYDVPNDTTKNHRVASRIYPTAGEELELARKRLAMAGMCCTDL